MSSPSNIYIAVVDDDESVCRALSRLLRASSMQPIAYSSTEAFLADKKHPTFDCLVLDINFNGMSGIDLQKKLVAEGSRAPVIFITSHEDPEVRRQAIEAGCSAYFSKTEPGSTVLKAIRKAIA